MYAGEQGVDLELVHHSLFDVCIGGCPRNARNDVVEHEREANEIFQQEDDKR